MRQLHTPTQPQGVPPPSSKSESALLIKFNPFSQILELFGEGNALEWIDSLQGVQPTTSWQCLGGKRGSPCMGLIPGGGTKQMCAQKSYKCPFLAITHLLPHRIIPQLMTGDRHLLISGLLHQPGVISQQPQSFSFRNLKWNSPFSRASHFTPIFFVCFSKLQSLNASQQCCYWALGSACVAGDLKSCKPHITWGAVPQMWSCFQFTNLLITVLYCFFPPPQSRRSWVLKKRGLFYKLNTVLLYFRLWYTVYTIN